VRSVLFSVNLADLATVFVYILLSCFRPQCCTILHHERATNEQLNRGGLRGGLRDGRNVADQGSRVG